MTATLEVEGHHLGQDQLGCAVVTNNCNILVTHDKRSLFLAQAM